MRKYVSIPTIVLAGTIATGASGAGMRVSLSALVKDPGRYLGHELELARGYCVQGGVSGHESGYQCSTDGKVWIAARALSPASAKKKVDANCGGMDVIERSASCGARI